MCHYIKQVYLLLAALMLIIRRRDIRWDVPAVCVLSQDEA